MRRRLTSVLLVLTTLFAATGCLKLDAEITIHEDESLSGTMTLAMSKEAMKKFEEVGEGLGGQGSEQVVDDEFFVADRVPDGASVSAYEDDTFVGQTMDFEEISLDELTDSLEAGAGSGWTLVRDGDRYVFEGDAAFTEQRSEELAQLDLGLEPLLAEADMRIAITFPGEVVEANGEIDGQTVTWRPEFGERQELRAVSEREAGPPWLLLGGGGLLLILLLGVPAVLALRQRRQQRPDASA